MKVYVIVEERGCGDMQSPIYYHATEWIYEDKEDAEKKANELWISNTTEDDRKSGWCALHYNVREREVIPKIEEDPDGENEEDLGLASCEQCGEKAWDGYICHSCGVKEI